MFNTFLPQHALSAVRILYSVCQSAPIQSELVGLFTADEVRSFKHFNTNKQNKLETGCCLCVCVCVCLVCVCVVRYVLV